MTKPLLFQAVLKPAEFNIVMKSPVEQTKRIYLYSGEDTDGWLGWLGRGGRWSTLSKAVPAFNGIPLACEGRLYNILGQQVGKSDKGFQELQIKI